MQDLIDKIITNKRIKINDNEYDVQSLTKYNTIEKEDEVYYKAVLSNHVILVILDDEVSYIGKIVENLNYKEELKYLVYEGNKYKFLGSGNQKVLEIIFGTNVEEECFYKDYEFEDNIISLGILTTKDNEKADVLAKYIYNSEIKVI